MTPKAGAEQEVLFNEPARLPCFCLVSSSSGRSKTAVLQSSKSEKNFVHFSTSTKLKL
jgi:hypothetical protein